MDPSVLPHPTDSWLTPLGHSPALLQLMLNVVSAQIPPSTAQHLNSICCEASTPSLLGAAWRHQRPSHSATKGQKAKEHPKTSLSLSCLSPSQPQEHKGTRKAKLAVSSIHSEEKLEEQERFLENPEEKILSYFNFPTLDIKNGQSAAMGRLCVLHSWGFRCGFGFFSSQEEQDNHKKQKIN